MFQPITGYHQVPYTVSVFIQFMQMCIDV